jgi:hypothetical protein
LGIVILYRKYTLMKTRIALLIFTVLSIVQPLAAQTVMVSLVELIANPKNYDGKVVQVIGFVSIDFEDEAIYLHSDDYKHYVNKNGLWIEITPEIRQKRAEYDQKYVILVGTFDATRKGHMGNWSGTIRNIKSFGVWMERGKQKENDASKK